jgi:hypothetical protein
MQPDPRRPVHPLVALLAAQQDATRVRAAQMRQPHTMGVYKPPHGIGRIDGRLPGSVRDPAPIQKFLSALLGVEPGSDNPLPLVALMAEGPVRALGMVGKMDDVLARTRVLDDAGKPRQVYHGTSHAFENFDPKLRDKEALYGPGFYWTEDAGTAGGDGVIQGYALKGQGDNPNVRPARLAIRNPFDVDDLLDEDEIERVLQLAESLAPSHDWDYARELIEARAETTNVSGDDLYKVLWKTRGEDGRPLGRAAANDVLQKAGFDGITHIGGKLTNNKSHRVWIAFDRSQIRSPFGDPAAAPQWGKASIPATALTGAAGEAGLAAFAKAKEEGKKKR